MLNWIPKIFWTFLCFSQLTMVWSWVIDTWGIPSSFNDEAIFCWTWTYQGYMIETCFFGDFAILAIVFLWNCANKCVKMWSLKSLSGRILQMQKPPTKNCNTTALLYHWNMKSNIWTDLPIPQPQLLFILKRYLQYCHTVS